RFLLKFGEVANYLGYNAMVDFFPTMTVRPNPQCEDIWCQKQQREYRAKKAAEPEPEKEEVKEEGVVHEDNEWDICLVAETTPEEAAGSVSAPMTNLAKGITVAYERLAPVAEEAGSNTVDTEGISLDDLMAQMKAL
ncbi:Ubiquitin-like modifier-activating enzyme 5-like 2, partial [Homarus americanus]